MQLTSDVREYSAKITKIGETELLGCAGASAYINILFEHIKDKLTAEVFSRLADARPAKYNSPNYTGDESSK